MNRKRSGLFVTIWCEAAKGLKCWSNLTNISYCAMKILPYQNERGDKNTCLEFHPTNSKQVSYVLSLIIL